MIVPTLPTAIGCVALLLATSIASAQLPGGGSGGTGSGAGMSPLVELQKGIGLLRKGKPAEAKEHFSKMIERDPDGMLPHYYLALALADLGDGKQCVVALGAAAERGWKEPEKFPEDAGLAALREKDESFKKALDAFAKRWRDRREKGTLRGHDLSTKIWIDEEGSDHQCAEANGRPFAILFVRAAEAQDLTALYTFSVNAKMGEDRYRALVLVECKGKTRKDQLERLALYRQETGVTLPLGLATDGLREALRPWREWPTLLWLDEKGKAQRAVEGFPADLEMRFEKLLGADSPD